MVAGEGVVLKRGATALCGLILQNTLKGGYSSRVRGSAILDTHDTAWNAHIINGGIEGDRKRWKTVI